MALYNSKGKISEMSEVKSGTSDSGYQWQNMTLVLECPGYQGTTFKQVFRVSGDSVEDVLKFKVGDRVEVSWSMYAREWNGKMYNNIDLVKINPYESAKATELSPSPAPSEVRGVMARAKAAKTAPAPQEEDSLEPQKNDLPF